MVWKLRGMRLKKYSSMTKKTMSEMAKKLPGTCYRDMLRQKRQKNQLHLKIKTKRMKKRVLNNTNRKKSQEKESDDALTINEWRTAQKRGREELSLAEGQGRDHGRAAERRHSMSYLGGAERSSPTTEVRGGGREEQPHVQGAVAARAQESREDLFHVQGQEGRPWGDTPRPR